MKMHLFVRFTEHNLINNSNNDAINDLLLT